MKKPQILLISFVLAAVVWPASLSTASPQSSAASACIPITTKQVAAMFNTWNDALQTNDPDKVVALYAKDAVLLPTLSNRPHTTPTSIRNYFVTFLQKHPHGTIDERVIRIGCDWATDTGLYTFNLTENGQSKQVQARYSFIYEYIDGKWLIVHHHSSMMPEVVEEGY